MSRLSSLSRSTCALLALCGAVASAGAAAALASSGCTVLTNDALPDDAGTFEGGGEAASGACTSCVNLECAGPWAVCLTDSRCLALRACDNSDPARDQCFCDTAAMADPSDGGAEPLPAYQAFASCNDARTCGKCATDCAPRCTGGARTSTTGSCGVDDAGTDAGVTDDGGDGGVAGDAGIVVSVDGCETCVSNNCDSAKKLCAIGSDCAAFLGCAYGCADATCVDACGKSHPSGRTSALELSSCTLTSCRSACGL